MSIVLADSSKLGLRAVVNVCPLEDIDVVITDEGAPATVVRAIEDAGVKVIIAK